MEVVSTAGRSLVFLFVAVSLGLDRSSTTSQVGLNVNSECDLSVVSQQSQPAQGGTLKGEISIVLRMRSAKRAGQGGLVLEPSSPLPPGAVLEYTVSGSGLDQSGRAEFPHGPVKVASFGPNFHSGRAGDRVTVRWTLEAPGHRGPISFIPRVTCE